MGRQTALYELYLRDDIVLDEAHIGHGLTGTGPANGAWWRAEVVVDIAAGDLLYVKAYNVPKDEIGEAGGGST